MPDSLKHQTRQGLYWKFVEQLAKYGMQFVISILLARMLTPADYGITALPGVLIAICGIFAGAGFGTALVRKPDLTEADLSTAFYYSTAVGIVICAGLCLAAPWVAAFYGVPVLTPIIRLTALGFVIGPLATPQTILLQRRLDFKTPMRIGVVSKLAGGIIGVVLAWLGYGVWALVWSTMGASLISLLLLWRAVRWVPRAAWSREAFSHLWGFGGSFMASQLLDAGYNNLAPLIIGKWYTPADLGVFNRAFSYASMPSQHLSGVVGSVAFPVLSRMQADDRRLADSYRRILRVTAFVVFPLMTLLGALARPTILVLFTGRWAACIPLLEVICLNMMWYPIHAINLNLLLVKGRSDLFLRLEVIKKVIGIVALVATLPLGLVAYCWGGVAFSLICLVVNTTYTRRIIHLGLGRQLADLAPALALALVSAAMGRAATLAVGPLWLQLAAGTAAGGLTYVGGALLLRMDELADVRYLLHRHS